MTRRAEGYRGMMTRRAILIVDRRLAAVAADKEQRVRRKTITPPREREGGSSHPTPGDTAPSQHTCMVDVGEVRMLRAVLEKAHDDAVRITEGRLGGAYATIEIHHADMVALRDWAMSEDAATPYHSLGACCDVLSQLTRSTYPTDRIRQVLLDAVAPYLAEPKRRAPAMVPLLPRLVEARLHA